MLAFSSPMGDSNRDLFHALNFTQRIDYPLGGPAIDHRMHYGPAWFYVLGLPLLFTKSWLAVSLWVGFLASAAFPLIYGLGRRLYGPGVGVAAAAMLALPSWASVYYLVYSHPSLVLTSVTLAGLATVAWYERQDALTSMLLGFALSLAFHTHISAVGVGLAGVVLMVVYGRDRPRRMLGQLALLGVGFLLPLAPYLVMQSASGWAEFSAGGEFVGNLAWWNNFLAVPAALRGLLAGPWFGLRSVAGVPMALAIAACAAVGLAWLTGAAGLVQHLRTRPMDHVVPFVALSLGGLLLTAVLIRNFTPFYQMLGLLPPLALLAGLGIVWMADTRGVRALMVLAVALLMLQVHGQWRASKNGVYRLDSAMMMNLRDWRFGEIETRWLLPAMARDANARWLCGHTGDVRAVGQWAAMLETSNLLETRIHCPADPPGVWIFGGEGTQLAGVHHAMAQALRTSSSQTIGPFHIWQPAEILSTGRDLHVSDPAIYPPRAPLAAAPLRRQSWQLALRPGEALVVVNVLNAWMRMESAELLRAGRPIEAVYDDRDSLAFRCDDCGTEMLELVVSAPDPGLVQVFKLAAE